VRPNLSGHNYTRILQYKHAKTKNINTQDKQNLQGVAFPLKNIEARVCYGVKKRYDLPRVELDDTDISAWRALMIHLISKGKE
jgi:hypothetical protein